MRIRTIKPEFWKDEQLAELTPWARLLFIGLWGLSDREGLLEDRPTRIKAEIFPYDRIKIEDLIAELARSPQLGKQKFIIRYEVDGLKMIKVRTFKKHQRISGREAESISILPQPESATPAAPNTGLIPPPGSTTEAPDKPPGSTTEATGKHHGSTGEASGTTGRERSIGKEEGGSLDLPPPPDGLLSQVKWIKSIRKEFEALRDVDIENALAGCPNEEARKAGMRDFGRDMIGALEVPPIPAKKLRGYLYRAEKDAAKTPAAGRPTPGIENLTAEELVERANDAVARKGI